MMKSNSQKDSCKVKSSFILIIMILRIWKPLLMRKSKYSQLEFRNELVE